MPYTPHLLVTWSGTLGANEIWTTGCRYRASDGSTPDSEGLDTLVEGIAPVSATQFHDGTSGIPGGVQLQYLKANWILANGKYRDPVTHLHEFSPKVNGTAGVFTPDFCTTSIQLATGFKRGRAHVGRMYWPNFGLAMDGMIPPSVTAVARGQALVWWDILSASVTGFRPIVASRLDGTVRDVTQWRMGNILDVQRRRKNKEPEVFEEHAVTVV